jgi:hypothetical protein
MKPSPVRYLSTLVAAAVTNATTTASSTSVAVRRLRSPVIWNNDHHPAPALDVKDLLEPRGLARILQTDLSNYCSHFGLCEGQNKIKVLTSENMFYLDLSLIPKFYEAYKDDPVMLNVDAFLCYDPMATCELFEPFNRSIIVVASNRFYVGRLTQDRYDRWHDTLTRFAFDPRHFVGANDLFDVNYMRFFTGIEATYLPSYCGYTNASYNPTSSEFLIITRQTDLFFSTGFLQEFADACKNLTGVPPLVNLDVKYKSGYRYADLATHRGIVHIPYQVSTMSLFEQYRMNIPQFFPSRQLLVRWISGRYAFRINVFRSITIRPPAHPSQKHIPHPLDTNSTMYWLQFADYYTMPYITYFESAQHLAEILRKLTMEDLLAISAKMKVYNDNVKRELLEKWTKVVKNIAKYSSFRAL